MRRSRQPAAKLPATARVVVKFHGDAFGTYEAYVFDGERTLATIGLDHSNQSEWFFTRQTAKTAVIKKAVQNL